MTFQLIRRRSAGFTLVEMLVVILIIGILMSLITGAAWMAHLAALNAAIRTDLNQLEMAMGAYKEAYGSYPPDFFGVALPPGNAIGDAARAEVVRHLRTAFPNYRPGSVSGSASSDAFRRFIDDLIFQRYLPAIPADYSGLDVYLNPATALPFWLGGMPADSSSDSSTKLMGFAANPKNPFDPNPAASRKPPQFEFDEARLGVPEKIADSDNYPFYYYAAIRPKTPLTPIVYFKARRNAVSGKAEYAVGGTTLMPVYLKMSTLFNSPTGGAGNAAAPYLENAWVSGGRDNFAAAPNNAKGHIRQWHKPKSCQIICAGLDGIFGDSTDMSVFRFTPAEEPDILAAGANLEEADHDNLTNFLSGKIGDEM